MLSLTAFPYLQATLSLRENATNVIEYCYSRMVQLFDQDSLSSGTIRNVLDRRVAARLALELDGTIDAIELKAKRIVYAPGSIMNTVFSVNASDYRSATPEALLRDFQERRKRSSIKIVAADARLLAYLSKHARFMLGARKTAPTSEVIPPGWYHIDAPNAAVNNLVLIRLPESYGTPVTNAAMRAFCTESRHAADPVTEQTPERGRTRCNLSTDHFSATWLSISIDVADEASNSGVLSRMRAIMADTATIQSATKDRNNIAHIYAFIIRRNRGP